MGHARMVSNWVLSHSRARVEAPLPGIASLNRGQFRRPRLFRTPLPGPIVDAGDFNGAAAGSLAETSDAHVRGKLMLMPTRRMRVSMRQLFRRRIANITNRDVEVQRLPGQWVVGVDGDVVTFDFGHSDD